ncbi:response regulator [Methylobacillus arboreus]|uniref:response regulator n=1 Tax=Methylobacillus arboreus TaxID=755170 RepID=UPI001E575012|nr:response regulator [Methylobacillus arboreus]MCB5190010.1 response regulator [Methylobacillus arboreus]
MAIKHILVVDDSATDRLYLSEVLQKAGFEISTAEDGQDCLDKVQALMPDLILMDVVMPRLNGFQATRSLSRNAATAHIPVIVCTGKEQATDRMWALRQGAKDCVIKPVDVDELLAKIAGLA